MVGDDPSHLPFIPFSDDPSFNLTRYLEEYPHMFSWQEPMNEPGLEMVFLETAREYLTQYPMPLSAEKCEALMLLLLKPISFPQLCKRIVDLPRNVFPGPHLSQTQQLPRETKSSYLLTNLLRDFCHNANCVVGFCSIHVGDIPLPKIVQPQVSSNAFPITPPCGRRCFLLGETSALEVIWDEREIDLLKTVLDYSPDLPPCDLAVICDKPCREVFSHRCRIIPDPPPTNESTQPILPRFSSDHDASQFVPEGPCGHDGPCSVESRCRCALNGAQCESSCRCDKSCYRRGRGCHCRKPRNGIKPCKTERCPCFAADRECDPDLCTSYFDADSCQNAGIQQGRFRRMEVRQSKWGLGVFMCEAAKKHDLIIEYIGELMYDASIDTRDLVAKHRGRNYVFQLNRSLSIDGSSLGNESRFINHDGENHNCYARVKLVNGEHRIGIYAGRWGDLPSRAAIDPPMQRSRSVSAPNFYTTMAPTFSRMIWRSKA
ncbi:hypothetical protein BD779DRAFT_1529722 [Infundibulicybe gibba]|nr:hypothetical protein BD779DRAFT_1529722 [Infundibulicybe gibba]